MWRRKPASVTLRMQDIGGGFGLFLGDGDVPELGDLVGDGLQVGYGDLVGEFPLEGFELAPEGCDG